MSMQTQAQDLAQRHRSLEKMIEAERSRPSRDSLKLVEMKRKKLQLKDQMERLQEH